MRRARTRAELAMARGDDGVFTARAAPGDRGGRRRLRLPAARRRRAPRSGVAPPAERRARAVAHRRRRRRSRGPTPAGAASPRADLVIYELHVGTFTPEGTFAGVAARLPHLRDLGVTAVELMPVAAFPGDRNWGYDGVYLFAPHTAYGGPDGLKRLVDACHAHGLALILDVVYNHLGPEGNYLGDFGPYFTDRYRTPWGDALNFDGADSDEVRRFFVDNALHWLREYHVDGLRLDAIQGIFDVSRASDPAGDRRRVPRARRRASAAHAWLIAESDLNDPRVIRPQGGRRAWASTRSGATTSTTRCTPIVTGNRRGYFADFGRVADVAKAITAGFVYDGQHAPHRRRRHGAPAAADAGRSLRVVHPEPRSGRERVPGAAHRAGGGAGAAEGGGGRAVLVAGAAAAVPGRGVGGGGAVRLLHQPRRSGAGRSRAQGAPRGVPAPAGGRRGHRGVVRSAGGGDVPALQAAMGVVRPGAARRNAGVLSRADRAAPAAGAAAQRPQGPRRASTATKRGGG